MAFEFGLHEAALYSSTAPVHDPHDFVPGALRGVDVFFHDRPDIARREGVEIELVFDRNVDRVPAHRLAFSFS